MKILLASRYFLHPSLNGASQLTRRMAAALASLGHEVRAVCLRPDGDTLGPGGRDNPVRTLVQDGIVVTSFPPVEPPFSDNRPLAERRFDSERFQWAGETLTTWRPDVVHLTAPHGLTELVHAAAGEGIPTVSTCLDFALICPQDFLLRSDNGLCEGYPEPRKCHGCLKHGTSTFSRTACRISRYAPGRSVLTSVLGDNRARTFDMDRAIHETLDNLDRVRGHVGRYIAPAPVARRMLESHGVPGSKIIDLVYSLPREKFIKAESRNGDSNPGKFLRIGFVGRPSAEKGLEVLLGAFLKLQNGHPSGSHQLWLAGNGMSAEKVAGISPDQGRCRQLIRDEVIRLYDGLQDLRLSNLVGQMDVCVVPSVCYECTPLDPPRSPCPEGPCIGSDTDGINHMIADRVNGRLFPPGDAHALAAVLQQLVDNPGTIHEWKAHLPVIQDDSSYAQRLTEIYQELQAR